MSELSYSFHLGNDKNKTKKARRVAKNNQVGSTNFNNNAIQNAKHLGKVNNHNLRMYENNQELINTIKGTNNIVNDVKELYLSEFKEAQTKYNLKQTRNDRKIDNYFNQISNDTKHDLACEIIIELGDMNYWQDKSNEERYKMTEVFKEQIKDLEKTVPSFKIANATIHFDESSPHLHIVGIAVKENCKTGMEKQVGKASIFTKDSLKVIQDEMRKECIKSYNKIYGLDTRLKEKQKGRNRDYQVNQMKDYEDLCNNYNKQQEKINEVNNSTDILNDKSDNIQNILLNLKQQPLSKNNSVISNENKQLLLEYIDDVNKSNSEIKSITNYSVSISKIKNDLEENYKKVEELETTVFNQNIEINKLNSKIDKKDNKIEEQKDEIEKLQSENSNLRELVDYWKDRFKKFIDFLYNKLHHWYEKDDKYLDVIKDLKEDNILTGTDIEHLSINSKNKKDDFER